MTKDYDIIEHKHRFAAWAAGRAASAKSARFTVEIGKAILEELGLRELVDSPDSLPLPEAFDAWHLATCEKTIRIAQKNEITLRHGSAAKLVNMYLKIIYSCGGHENHARVAAIHPPIDNLLLEGLIAFDSGERVKVWSKARKKGWSKFDAGDYLAVIGNLKAVLGDEPLWKAEAFWRGHQ